VDSSLAGLAQRYIWSGEMNTKKRKHSLEKQEKFDRRRQEAKARWKALREKTRPVHDGEVITIYTGD